MSIAMIPCETCGHRRGLHRNAGSCRAAECYCAGFVGVTPIDQADDAPEPTGNLVTIVVPDGFSVVVTLYPIPKEDPTDG